MLPETTMATNLALSIESDVLSLDCTNKASTVLIMTESTVSGKHDIKRVAKLAAPLGIDTVKLRPKTLILKDISNS